MRHQITYSERFKKSYKKLTLREQKLVQDKVMILSENPMHPSLRVKRIKGTVDLYECSVNMDIRVIWYYEGDEIILLLDVGHHDILNKF